MVRTPSPPNRANFRKKVRDLKSGNYYHLIGEIQEDLGLTECSRAEIEAMLIKAAEDMYPDNGIETDVILVALGLLKGYDNRSRKYDVKVPEAKRLLTERNTKFLKNSTYKNPQGQKTVSETDNSSLTKKEGRYLDKVAEFILDKKNIENYVKSSAKKYLLTEKEYIPEKFLPELQHPRKDHPAETKKPKPGTVCNYIEKIQISDKYDDVGVELYQKLCHTKDNPPYDEWVATWLIKCIIKKFHETLKADVLRASFALLNGYELADTSVEERLDEYLEKSNYLALRYDGEYFCIEDIEDENKLAEIKEELKGYERDLLKKLITYIKQRPEQAKYIEKLEKYGKLIERDGKKIYTPNEQRLYGGKKKKNKRLKMINKLFKGYNNIDAISLKNTIYKESEKIPKVAMCLVISIIACYSFLAIKPKNTVTTFDKNPYSNLSGIPSCIDYGDYVVGHNSMLPVDGGDPYLEHLAMDNSED